jgi:hypothetical protein
VSELFPAGITALTDLPYTLHEAIVRALLYLSWEELPKEDRPPRKMWLDADELGAWFKAVERRRDEQYGTHNSSSGIEDPVENAAAKDLVSGG